MAKLIKHKNGTATFKDTGNEMYPIHIQNSAEHLLLQQGKDEESIVIKKDDLLEFVKALLAQS